MAAGGWGYYSGRCVLVSNFDDGSLTTWANEVTAVIEQMPNWTLKTGPTKYISNAWFVVYSNSVTLAELAFIWVRDSNGNFLDASNNFTGTTLNSYYYEYTHWVAYCPPGAVFTGANPNTAGFVPSTGFVFARINSTGEWDNPGYHWLHCLVRDDDDLILLWEYDGDEDSGIERTILAGGCAIPIHASDSGSRKNEAMVVSPEGNNLSSGNVVSQYFKADNTTRIISGRVEPVGYPVSDGTGLYTHGYPWPAQECVLYKTGNPTTEGVVAGNMIKGWVNPEWYRMMQGNAPGSPKQIMDGGNYIFIRDWGLVGWDPSNGAMR